MKLKHQISGAVFQIVALELNNGQCPAIGYLTSLKSRSPSLHETMHARIKFRADHLLIANKNISRPLSGGRYNDLFRLVVKGERLLYCFLPQGVVVLLNGYNKNDVEKSEWEKARKYNIDLREELRLN